MPNSIIFDGDWLTAQPDGAPRFSPAFDRDTDLYLLEQDYFQLGSNFSPLALNTPHPDFPSYILVAESAHESQIGGVVKWKRTYAKRPPTRNDYSSLSYNFIGYYGAVTVNISTLTGRSRFVNVVDAREEWVFFLTPTDYATADLIPTINGQQYYFPAGTSRIASEFVVDSPPFNIATVPSRSTYESWIASGTEFPARDSNLVNWMGNFWIRKTLYIKAQ